MTVKAPYLPHAKRIFEHNLNAIKFDCSRASRDQYLSECINSTLWHDLKPLLVEAVSEKAQNGLQIFREIIKERPNLDREHPVTRFICQKFLRTHIDFILKDIAFGLAEAFENATAAERRVFIPHVYENIAAMFRRYVPDDSAYMATILLKAYYYHKDYLESETIRDCRAIVANRNISADSMAFAASVVSALGMTDFLKELKLGQFLTIGTTSLKSVKDKEMDESQAQMYNKLARILPMIGGTNATEISANLAYYYLSLDKGYPENHYGSQIKCNMRTFIYHISANQSCRIDANSSCCQLEKAISKKYDLVLKLMKYTVAPTAIPVREKAEKSEAELLSKDVQYTLRHKEPSNTQPVIVACKYGEQGLSEKCKLFSRLYSTFGIGYTFNNAPFFDLLKNSSQNYIFYKEVYEQVNDSFSFEDLLPRKTFDYGKPYALEFYISHSPYENTKSSTKNAASFRRPLLKIHDPFLLPDLRNSEIELEPGMDYDISVIPSVTTTDHAGLQLSEVQRDCRPRTEDGHLEIFKGYSKSSCFIECKLKQAFKQCKCVPWDYPRWPGVSLCRFKAAADCFEGAMGLRVDPSECDCPNDCDYTQYILMPIIKPLSLSKLCARTSQTKRY